MLISIILSFLPSKLQNYLRRVLLKQDIAPSVKIGFFVVIQAKKVTIKSGTRIKYLTHIVCDELEIGENCIIYSHVNLNTRKIKLGSEVKISSNATVSGSYSEEGVLEIGDFSWVFPYCWLDTKNGIYIGKNVGIGGHTFIFTHSNWQDFLTGGPLINGPVFIEDDVWLPWRVFIGPNTTIGKGAIIGAHSFVSKNVDRYSFSAGSPVKKIAALKEYDINNESDKTLITENAIKLLEIFKKSLEKEHAIRVEKISDTEFKIDNLSSFFLVTDNNIDLTKIRNKDIIFNLDADVSKLLPQTQFSSFDYITKKTKNVSNSKVSEIFYGDLSGFGIRMYKEMI